ncbi:MAG: hypothetical protein RSB59_01900 [Clostridia bacterium]
MKKFKKIILALIVVFVVATMATALTACSHATVQGQLANILDQLHNYEVFSYDVAERDGSGNPINTGTYKVEIEGYDKGSTVTLGGGVTLTGTKAGVLVKGHLEIADVEFNTACYFDLITNSTYLAPNSTYRSESKSNKETLKLTGSYSGGNLSYKLTQNGGAETSGSVSAKAPFYDNNEFHQMLRGATSMSEKFSFSFNVPVVGKEIAVAQLTAVVTGKEKIKTTFTDTYTKGENAETPFKADGVECYKTTISRFTEVAGKLQTLYYSTSDIKINGFAVKRPLIKIVEPTKNGNVVYSLKSISLTK